MSLCPGPTIKTGGLFLAVFDNYRKHERRQLPRRQHAIDDARREAGALMLSFEDCPRGTTREPKHLGLLTKRAESRTHQCLTKLADFGALSRLLFYDWLRALFAREILLSLR